MGTNGIAKVIRPQIEEASTYQNIGWGILRGCATTSGKDTYTGNSQILLIHMRLTNRVLQLVPITKRSSWYT